MWITLERRKFAILTLSNESQVHLRQGEPYEITEEEWNLQPGPIRALFDVQDPLPVTDEDLASMGAGAEILYAERTANDTTTNITATNVALMANLIPGLSLLIVGEGRPVDIEFQSRVRHSTAGGFVSSVLMTNGDGLGAMSQWWTRTSPTTSGAVHVYGKRRLLLAEDVEYTFEIGKQLGAAGTGTWEGAPYWPTFLMATKR